MGERTPDVGIFRAILEGVNEAVITIGLDGTLLATNPSGRRIFGLKDEHLGRKFFELDLFSEGTTNDLISLFGERLSRDTPMTREMKAEFKDGTIKWLRIDSFLIKDTNGETSKLATVIDDITDRKRYEKALEESESRFRTVVESLLEGLGITDEQENIIYANDSLCQLAGYHRDEIVGANLSLIVSKDEFDKISKRSEGRRKGTSEIYESQIIRKDGDIKDVLISAAPWTNEEGDFLGSIGLLLDISERKTAEKALRENEEKYRATVEQSAENIYIYDLETNTIVESNSTLQELLGYSAEEMKELKPSDFIAHSDEDIGSQIMRVIRDGKAIVGERTYYKKNGGHVEVEVSASHIKYGDRSMLCVVSRDITEKKRSREQIIEERNRAEFYLDLLAHDIGNLHHGILTGIDMVQLTGEGPPRNERAMKLVRGLLLRSIKLVDNVMTFSSLRSMPLEKRPLELRPLVEKGLDSAREAMPETELEHEMKWNVKDILVLAEPLLQEAFFNIYHNALKYQKMDPAVVETLVEGTGNGTVKISISDHGPGIPDERKEAIFDRMKDPMKKQHSGLGMSIVRALVERYGGTVSIENRIPEDHKQGTSFVIEIPIE